MEECRIDRRKLRAAIRKLRRDYVFSMLDEAVDVLSEDALVRLVKGYLDVSRLMPDVREEATLLADVKAFEKASLAREYYEGFAVNSHNFTEQSNGTSAWLCECRRLLERCVAAQEKGEPTEICQAFEILFDLLDHIDEGDDDMIFFADEGGSWQVGVDWREVLPAWFKVLGATASPVEFAERVVLLVGCHCGCDRDELVAAALTAATPEQREVLSAFSGQRFDGAYRQLHVSRRREKEDRKKREMAAARQRYLEGIASDEAALWVRVDELVSSTKPRAYDEAVQLLVDLRDLDVLKQAGLFQGRLAEVCKVHGNKRTFIRKLDREGL